MTVRALSLFAGIGGLDLGARATGVDVKLATDIDPRALGYLARRDGTNTVTGDLRELVRTGELRDSWTGKRPNLLIGGPPCTAFSHAGFWLDHKRNGQDPAAGLLGAYIDVLRQFEPDVFVMENVPGLTFSTHDAFFSSFLNRARRAGYGVTWQVINAAEYGTAQRRRRLFVVGLRDRSVPAFNLQRQAERTAGWALNDVASMAEPDEQPTGKYSELLAEVPPGGNYLVFTSERGATHPVFKYRGRYWSFLLKIDPEQAAPTLPAQRVTWNGPFHWKGRHLRVRELARLQGFPDWQSLDGSLPQVRRWIGNSVPPLLGMQVVRAALRAAGYHFCNDWHVLGDKDASFTDVAAVLQPKNGRDAPVQQPALPPSSECATPRGVEDA